MAIVKWSSYRLVTEVQLRETVRDVKFLHNGQFFAAAQKKYTYIYDKRGVEIHCLKEHVDVNRLEFLPHHFLLASVGEQGILRYQDTTHGAIVAQFRTKLGGCDAMRQNPQNAVVHLGHSNGTVTLWSPNMGHPLVKMLTHRGPVRSLAVDGNGRYMATAGADSQVKVWDLRTYKEVHAYFAAVPVGRRRSSHSFERRRWDSTHLFESRRRDSSHYIFERKRRDSPHSFQRSRRDLSTPLVQTPIHVSTGRSKLRL